MIYSNLGIEYEIEEKYFNLRQFRRSTTYTKPKIYTLYVCSGDYVFLAYSRHNTKKLRRYPNTVTHQRFHNLNLDEIKYLKNVTRHLTTPKEIIDKIREEIETYIRIS